MGYCGAKDIETLKQTGKFVKISAASLKEILLFSVKQKETVAKTASDTIYMLWFPVAKQYIVSDYYFFWNGIKTEKVGINPIINFDTTEYKAKLSADEYQYF